MTRVPYPILVLLALGAMISLMISLPGCAVLQGAASATGGYLTKSEFDQHDDRIDAIEGRVKSIERWSGGK